MVQDHKGRLSPPEVGIAVKHLAVIRAVPCVVQMLSTILHGGARGDRSSMQGGDENKCTNFKHILNFEIAIAYLCVT